MKPNHGTDSPLRTLAVAVWPVATLMLLYRVVQASGGEGGWDFRPVVVAVHRLFEGGPVYMTSGATYFPYPPSALVLLSPFALVDVERAVVIEFVLNFVAILAAALLSLKLFELDWRSPAGALTVLALSLAQPVSVTLHTGNVNGFILLGLVASLYAATRSHWTTAGAALGLTLALKPILVPLVLVFALYRRWRAAAVAVAIPSILSAILMAVVPRTRDFVTETIPFLLGGQTEDVQTYSASLSSVGELIGIPSSIVDVLRVVVVISAVAVIRMLWRVGVEPLRLIEISAVSLIAVFLVSSFSFSHYAIYLLPAAMSIVWPDSAFRSPVAWVAMYLVAAQDVWRSERLAQWANDLVAARPAVGFLMLLAVFWAHARRRRPAPARSGYEADV